MTHKRSTNILQRSVVVRFRKSATPAFLAEKLCVVMQRNQFTVSVKLLEDATASYIKGSLLTVAPSELSHPQGCTCKTCLKRGPTLWKS